MYLLNFVDAKIMQVVILFANIVWLKMKDGLTFYNCVLFCLYLSGKDLLLKICHLLARSWSERKSNCDRGLLFSAFLETTRPSGLSMSKSVSLAFKIAMMTIIFFFIIIIPLKTKKYLSCILSAVTKKGVHYIS